MGFIGVWLSEAVSEEISQQPKPPCQWIVDLASVIRLLSDATVLRLTVRPIATFSWSPMIHATSPSGNPISRNAQASPFRKRGAISSL